MAQRPKNKACHIELSLARARHLRDTERHARIDLRASGSGIGYEGMSRSVESGAGLAGGERGVQSSMRMCRASSVGKSDKMSTEMGQSRTDNNVKSSA